MKSVRVPLTATELHQLDRLSKGLKRSRSTVARQALTEGLMVLKLRHALALYEREEVTLGWAAEFAGLSISEMADVAAARGIPYFRYSPEELERDVKFASTWLRRARRQGEGGRRGGRGRPLGPSVHAGGR